MPCAHVDHRASHSSMPDAGFMPRQIHLERRYGDSALLDGVKIGPLAGILPCACRANPVDWSAVRVRDRDDRLGLVAKPEPWRRMPVSSAVGPIRHVDVQNESDGREPRSSLCTSSAATRAAVSKCSICPRVPDERDRNRRQPEEAPFHRGGHSAGIDDVVAKIGAVIDT